MKCIIFRIDDVGASTKLYNQHGKTHWRLGSMLLPLTPFANIGPIKRLRPFKSWAPYTELSVEQIYAIGSLLRQKQIRMTVAITACWVTGRGELIPFPIRFPKEAMVWKELSDEGIIEIANHGLTHCIVGQHLPKFFSSNRTAHREFYPTVSLEEQISHIHKAQEILESYFQVDVVTFVPPGNMWSSNTIKALKGTHLSVISCSRTIADRINEADITDADSIRFIIDEGNTFAFHDKDIQENGLIWLERQIDQYADFSILDAKTYARVV